MNKKLNIELLTKDGLNITSFKEGEELNATTSTDCEIIEGEIFIKYFRKHEKI